MAAAITLTPNTGNVGSTCVIDGTGFANEVIDFTYGGASIVPTGAPITAVAGAFSATITIPASIKGIHAVTATDQSAGTDSKNYTVTTNVVITENNAKYGDVITVTGTGYSNASAVTTTLNAVGITAIGGAFSSNATGGWSKTFTIPEVANGSRTFDATDAGAATDTDTLIIDAYITLDDSIGNDGDTIVITGHGFTASSLLAFTFGGDLLTVDEDPLSSGATGAFATATFTVPTGYDGNVSVVCTDASAKTDNDTFYFVSVSATEMTVNSTYSHLSGRDNRLRSVNSVPSRERGAMVDIPFNATDTYVTGGVQVDFSGIDNFSQVYLCKIIHNEVGLVCSYVPAAGNDASTGKIKFWGTNGSELADNSGAITSKSLRVFIRGI